MALNGLPGLSPEPENVLSLLLLCCLVGPRKLSKTLTRDRCTVLFVSHFILELPWRAKDLAFPFPLSFRFSWFAFLAYFFPVPKAKSMQRIIDAEVFRAAARDGSFSISRALRSSSTRLPILFACCVVLIP